MSKLGLLPCESLSHIICFIKGNRRALIRPWFYVPFLLLLASNASAQTMVPEFTANTTSGCAGTAISFRDLTTGNPKYWNWDFGNGTLSTVQNPTVVYASPGTYTVALVVRNADGTTGITKTNYITISAAPAAEFTSDYTIGCLPSTIQFRDQSSAASGIASWQWDFGDGTTSTQQSPQKTYNKIGFYSVNLTVTSNSGCKSSVTKSRYIRIVAGVKAEFDFSNNGACQPPFPIKFINNSSGPGNMTFQWDLGNSTTSTATNPSNTYTSTGTYNVTLTATSEFGCSGTITKPIVLDGPTTSIKVPDSVCQNQKVFFVNEGSATPQKVSWDFGNGDGSPHLNDSTVYPNSGDYTVKLVNTYATCVDSATKNIYVRRSPDIDFSVTNSLSCRSPLTVTFSDATPVSQIVDWVWIFGDGSTGTGKTTTHTYNTADTFDVSVIFTDNAGCEGRITKPAIVKIIKPTVTINNVPTGGCVSYTFNPTASVQAIDGVASWLWDFGDGSTSNQQFPSHTYTSTGKYTVKLTITTNGGCTETTTVPDAVLVGTPPVVDFSMSANDVCASTAVQFTDLTTPAATLNKWEWDFGDGTTSNEKNPLHEFEDIGTFTVVLKAYNNGCPATSVGKPITIRPPVAKFTYDVTCGAFTVNFLDQSLVDPAFGPVSYSWNFGDGSPVSTDKDPVHTFPALNTPYTVTLTVTNGTCTDTYAQTVKLLRELPDFTISQPACRNAPITLTSTNNVQNISFFEWSFDGGAYDSSDRDTTVTFSTFGNHTINLRITDLNGCVDVKSGTVNVVGPTAAFVSNDPGGCKNDTVFFTDNSTPAGTITKWTFDFGDGQSQSFTQPPFKHAYQDTGEYRVKLTVLDNQGCIDTISLADTIFIGQLRTWFYAEYDTICPTSSLQFYDSSEGKGLTYLWHFGDGTTSTLQNPTHIYGGSETSYNVELVISDRGGCTDSVTRNRYITTIKPKPAFDIQDTTTICPPIETKFTFRGSDYDSLYWDFGDGFTSTLQNPTHFYNSYGDFEAKLYLVGYGGCLDSASHMVHVYEPNANTTWTYSPLDACNELTVDFSITTPPGTTFTFLFGDGTYDTSQVKTFQHYYGSPAFYHPTMLLNDAQECQVSVGGPNIIKVIGAEPFFGVDRKKFCDSGVVYFTNYTIGNDPVVTRVWDFGDGSPTTGEENPVHYYDQPGTYVTSQSVTTQTGCSKTIRDTIRVYRTPEPILNNDTACINEPFTVRGLLAIPDTSISWVWTMGNGTKLTTQDISLTFPDKGTYKLYLQATNLVGCTDSTSADIFVPPTPEINIESQPVIPVTTGVTLPVTYGEGIATYAWTPAKNLSCTDCPTPYANPTFTTTYKIEVTDVYGCTNLKDITVTVICNGLNYFLPNTFSPNGDGVNDVFAPRGVGLNRINSMKIFNRWGELVFEKMNFLANDRTPSGGWDGTYKGKPASPDVYVYIIEFVCDNAQVVPVKGNVALIR